MQFPTLTAVRGAAQWHSVRPHCAAVTAVHLQHGNSVSTERLPACRSPQLPAPLCLSVDLTALRPSCRWQHPALVLSPWAYSTQHRVLGVRGAVAGVSASLLFQAERYPAAAYRTRLGGSVIRQWAPGCSHLWLQGVCRNPFETPFSILGGHIPCLPVYAQRLALTRKRELREGR